MVGCCSAQTVLAHGWYFQPTQTDDILIWHRQRCRWKNSNC